jgi:hypothetical protein
LAINRRRQLTSAKGVVLEKNLPYTKNITILLNNLAPRIKGIKIYFSALIKHGKRAIKTIWRKYETSLFTPQ